MDDNNTRSVNDDGELQTTMQPYMSDNDAATNATEAQATASVGSALKDAPVVAWEDTITSVSGDSVDDVLCSFCLAAPPVNPVELLKCKDIFCKFCIDNFFAKFLPKCPRCGLMYGPVRGTQPDNGTMEVRKEEWSLAGHEDCGTITIEYDFPAGTQTVSALVKQR